MTPPSHPGKKVLKKIKRERESDFIRVPKQTDVTGPELTDPAASRQTKKSANKQDKDTPF